MQKMPTFNAEASLPRASESYKETTTWNEGQGRQAVVPQFCLPCIPIVNRKLCCGIFGCKWRRC